MNKTTVIVICEVLAFAGAAAFVSQYSTIFEWAILLIGAGYFINKMSVE